MSRVITFSRTYPSYHPKAGQKTHFVEKVLNALCLRPNSFAEAIKVYETLGYKSYDGFLNGIVKAPHKHHTIRAGHRWKAGDRFSPRVWSGKPYNSKQIQFAPEIQVKKTWGVVIIPSPEEQCIEIYINEKLYYSTSMWMDDPDKNESNIDMLAINDGLYKTDLMNWFIMSPDFKKKNCFEGQIICWNESINY